LCGWYGVTVSGRYARQPSLRNSRCRGALAPIVNGDDTYLDGDPVLEPLKRSVMQGLLPLLVQRRHSPLGKAPAHKMERQLRGNRGRLRSIALCRQALPYAAVHLHSLQLSQSCGQYLAIECMLKPVAPTEGPVRPLCQAGGL
jgi:hypothetical protein